MDVYTYRDFLCYQGFQIIIRMYNVAGLVHNARFIPVLAKLQKLLFACNLQIETMEKLYSRFDTEERFRAALVNLKEKGRCAQ